MFRRREKLVLGVQHLQLFRAPFADRPFEDQSGTQSDARQLLPAEPLHDQETGSVEDGRLDRTASLTWIDPHVLDHPGELAATATFSIGDRDRARHRGCPFTQVFGTELLGGPCQLVQQFREEGHEGQVWQYRPRCTSGYKESQVHVIIAGCGRVGSELATNLQRLGHSIAVVDKNRKAFERLRADFAGTTVVGFAFDREVLDEAGIGRAEAFAAVTSGDNSNILGARVAKDHYRIPHVVARIYDPRRAQIYQRLGIQTVATVRWTTDQILRSLIPDEVPVEYTVDNGEVVVTAVPVPTEIVGKKALEIDASGLRRAVAVSRFGVPRIPDKDFTLQEGDIVYVAAARSHLNDMDDEIKRVGQPE